MPLPLLAIATFARVVRKNHDGFARMPAEREMLVAYMAVVEGRTINQIATICGSSPKTIDSHRRRFIEKMSCEHAGVMWARLRADYAEATERAEAPPV